MKVRSSKHRKFVANLPCLITGRQGEGIHPHHLLRVPGEHGMGVKACDVFCIPLWWEIHNALHKNGNEVAFFANHGMEYEWVVGHALAYAEESPDKRIRKKVKLWQMENGNE